MAMRLFCSSRRPTSTTRRKLRFRLDIRVEVLEDRTLLSGFAQSFATPGYVIYHPAGMEVPYGSPGPTGYTLDQIRHAYGFDQISFPGGVKADGSGTTIAIVDANDDPTIVNDLHQFDVQFNLPDPTFTKVNQTGGSTLPVANKGWAGEIALDVEWAHAIAPGANILLVETTDSSLDNLAAGTAFAARQPGVVAVSMSWGGSEFSGETAYDSNFRTPSGHTGVTFVVASGDNGPPVGYPGTSPNVLTVGGTTLKLDSQGNILSETGWSGSTGGVSTIEAQPAYQNGVVTQSSTRRANPDVAYDSDPNTGFPVYDSYNNGTTNPWTQDGGTSDAAPQWSALIAIADQGRILNGLSALDGASQLLPMLYGKLPSADFHDITSGSARGRRTTNSDAAGYDLVTGIGTPVANKLVADLAGIPTVSVTHFSVSAPASSTAGSAFSVTVTALDQNNQVVPGYTGTVHFTSSDGMALVPANYTFTAGDNGMHTFTNAITLKKAGSQTVTLGDASATTLTGSATVGVTAANANHLGFGQQPANAGAGSAISPAVTVQVFDLYNNLVTTDSSDQITLTLGANPGTSTLSGTTTVTVSGGIATFSNLALNKTGTGYTLTASSGSLTGATSSVFNITPGKASELTFGQQPTNTPTGSTITPAVTVQILDANGNLVTTDSSDAVTIGLGANPGGGSLSGSLTVTAQNGVATFSNLALSKTGTSYTLTASSGSLAGTTSTLFNVTQAGTHLVFSGQPTNAAAGSTISPTVTVQVLDAGNNLVTTDSSDQITLTLSANPGASTLSGTTTVTVSGGIATFNSLALNKTGTGYTLTASSSSLTGATSSAFNITPGKASQLAFAQQPTNTKAGSTITPAVTVQILDANGNLVTTDNSDTVTVGLGTNSGGTLSGTSTQTVGGGVATFGNLSLNKTGSYTLTASASSLGSATSGNFAISPGTADHLAFAQQPTTTTVGASITPAVTVQILDVNNNLVTGDNTDTVTLTLTSNPSGVTLSGTTTATVSNGIATFGNLSVTQAGTGDTLTSSSGSLKTATSTSFNVTATVASTVLEDFENGLGKYRVASSFLAYATTTTRAAHDGTYGLDLQDSVGWIYRSDTAAQVQQGDTLSAWVRLATAADGRVYFGFGASRNGTLSVVLAPNTGGLVLQDNSGYGYVQLAAVPQSYVANHWYRLEVAWGTDDSITGRLYDSDGSTLLNSVQATANDITAGGIAFRGTFDDKYVDTVTVTHTGSPHLLQLGAGDATVHALGGAIGDVDAPRSAATSRRVEPGGRSQPALTDPTVSGTSSPSGSSSSVSRGLVDILFLSNSPPVVGSAALFVPIAVRSPGASETVRTEPVPDLSPRLTPARQESGGASNDPLAIGQDQDAERAPLPDGATQSSNPTRAEEERERLDVWLPARQERAVTDAYFTSVDLSAQDQGAVVPLLVEIPASPSQAEGGSGAAIAAVLLGFARLEACDTKERARRWARR